MMGLAALWHRERVFLHTFVEHAAQWDPDSVFLTRGTPQTHSVPPLAFSFSIFFVAVASCNLLAFLLMCWHSARSVQWVPFDSVIKLGKRCGRRTRFLFVAGFVDILT